MKSRWLSNAGMGLLLIVLSACNYPGFQQPTHLVTPAAPALTLTALFGVTPLPNTGTTPTPALTGVSPSPTDNTLPTQAETQPPTATSPVATLAPATPTQAATLAPTSTVSFAGPPQRENTPVSAIYFEQKPVIDADFGEWQAERYLVDRVVFGRENWEDAQDLWARAMFGWDAANFYVAVRVRDDVYAQDAAPDRLFEGDSLELLFDLDVAADYYEKSLSSDDFQIGISPGESSVGSDPVAYLWYPRAAQSVLDQVKIAAAKNDDGYRVEVAIPWEILGIVPRNGQHLGFAFSVSDNDNPQKNHQDSMVSTVPRRILTDPTTWGDLTLLPAP